MREAARAMLTRWGASLRDLLGARRDDPDPEVRRVVREILARVPAEPERPPTLDVGTLGLVTLEARGPLVGVLRVLGRDAGLTFDVPGGYGASAAEVHVAKAPFFQALEAICEGVGLAAPEPFDAAGAMRLAIPTKDAPRLPSAAVGPFRARVERVTAAPAAAGGASRWSVAVALHWAPYVQVVATRTPRVLEATAAGGGEVRAAAVSDALRAADGPYATDLEVSLVSTGAAPERLAALEVAVPLRLRHRRVNVRFAGIARLPRSLPSPASTGAGDAGSVTLQAVRPPEAAGAPWTVELRVRLPVPPPTLVVTAEDAAGEPTAVAEASRDTAADGTVLWTGRLSRPAGRGPAALRVAWYAAEEDAEARFRWEDVRLR